MQPSALAVPRYHDQNGHRRYVQALAQRTIGGKVLIDVCPAHGTWFDRDEVVQVIEAMRKRVPGGSGGGSYGYGTTNEAVGQSAVALVQLLFTLFAALKSE